MLDWLLVVPRLFILTQRKEVGMECSFDMVREESGWQFQSAGQGRGVVDGTAAWGAGVYAKSGCGVDLHV